ncbi:hypothetical protein BaRGS_00016034 [Batillaria attramentaria]|uniref:Uncharacterized protein n=1 Tax=Batillaria attramentaria TaxID=370345 RepID=A0ABD0L0Y3_9CAEN
MPLNPVLRSSRQHLIPIGWGGNSPQGLQLSPLEINLNQLAITLAQRRDTLAVPELLPFINVTLQKGSRESGRGRRGLQGTQLINFRASLLIQ